MLKKLLAILLSGVLLLGSVPMGAGAASSEEEQRIRDQITSVYWQTLSSSGRSSLHGFCGVMAGWELYHLGVTETAVTNNGNEMYDILKVSDQIRQGYSAQCYPASEYTIEEALDTITRGGTEDAYNILVGFQRTRTAAGSLYGHVTIVHAVLNGNVYFTEGFMTPYNADPSQAMVCTISEFDEYYNSWATFEGMIHFGDGSRVSGCDTYGCDLFVASQESVILLAEPKEDAQTIRVVAPGERLYANALCQNGQQTVFYRIMEDGQAYYALANQLAPVWFVADGVETTDITLPSQVDQGEDFWISGVIRSGKRTISGCVLEIRDKDDRVISSWQIDKETSMLDLGTNAINARSDLGMLADGCYTYAVFCDLTNRYYQNGEIRDYVQRVLVQEQPFLVGSAVPEEMSKSVSISPVVPKTVADGWQYREGKWYYLENGEYVIGWLCRDGIDYYFLSDGSAATGWQNINGRDRYFSQTGAMRTGWLETENGTYYMLRNGVAAVGQMQIETEVYVFGEDGLLLTE